jgi:integrase
VTGLPRVAPVKRRNPSGRTVWQARYPLPDGRTRSAGSFARRSLAQDAIDEALKRVWGGPSGAETVGGFAATWTKRHPRSPRTNATNYHRVGRVLDVMLEGAPLRNWQLADLRRRHAVELVDVLLRKQRRSASGAQNILRTLSAMSEDAVAMELAEVNPFKGVRVRADDPRVTKAAREAPVYTFGQMHAFARQGGAHEAMLRVLSDCGLRLGELLGLERADWDGDVLRVRGSGHNGTFTGGDQATKRHVREVPVSPSLQGLLAARPARIDTPVLFATPQGRIWREDNWRRDVWNKVRNATDEDGEFVLPEMRRATPHAFRHSWESHLHAAGVDPADLADMAGHSVATMHARYVHALKASHDRVRSVVG